MSAGDTDRDYADRLAQFIIDHIGVPYSADECGHVLEIRSSPLCSQCEEPTANRRTRWHDGSLVRLCDACIRVCQMTGDLP